MPPCPSRPQYPAATLKSSRHPILCSLGIKESTSSLHVPQPPSRLTLVYGCVLRKCSLERSPPPPRNLVTCENVSRNVLELLGYACGSASPSCPITLRYTRRRWIENLLLV